MKQASPRVTSVEWFQLCKIPRLSIRVQGLWRSENRELVLSGEGFSCIEWRNSGADADSR